jgi:hypothetical protein
MYYCSNSSIRNVHQQDMIIESNFILEATQVEEPIFTLNRAARHFLAISTSNSPLQKVMVRL